MSEVTLTGAPVEAVAEAADVVEVASRGCRCAWWRVPAAFGRLGVRLGEAERVGVPVEAATARD